MAVPLLENRFSAATMRICGSVRYALLRAIHSAHRFAHGIDHSVAVVVVFGKDEGFGDPFHLIFIPVAFGKAFFQAAVFIGLDDGADLVGGQDDAVELFGEPFFFLVEYFEAFLFGEAVSNFDGGAGVNFVALFGELGFDAVDVVAHIDLVDHGVFVSVFGDKVLPDPVAICNSARGLPCLRLCSMPCIASI